MNEIVLAGAVRAAGCEKHGNLAGSFTVFLGEELKVRAGNRAGSTD